MKKLIKVRIIFLGVLFLLAIFIILFLVNKNFGITGKITSVNKFKKKNPIISEITPNARVGELGKEKGKYYMPIINDPVYFDIKFPRGVVDKVKLILEYSKSDNLPSFYLGPQKFAGFNYGLSPVENELLDGLIENNVWDVIRENNIVFLQREKNYNSIEEFLSDLPNTKEIGVYNYDLSNNYVMKDYLRKKDGIEIAAVLRGSHDLITYLKNEFLGFEFLIQDINRHDDADDFIVRVFNKDNEVVKEVIIEDDGYISSNDPASPERRVDLFVPGLPDGLYKIQIVCSEDIFIKNIKTKQSYCAFVNKVYLAGNKEYSDGLNDLNILPTTIYSNGKKFTFRTTHQGGLQIVLINENPLDIQETHTVYHYDVNDYTDTSIIGTNNNDLLIQTKGLIGFHNEDLFNPYLLAVDENIEAIPDYISYIIADYQTPVTISDNIKRYEQTFSINDFFLKDGKAKIMLSIPRLDIIDGQVNIYKIKTEIYTKWPGFNKIFSFLKNKFKK